MCGIFGTINKNIELSNLKNLLLHRGPDAQTSWSHDNIQLFHFRLSILDLEGGKQPMRIGNRVIVFNGEIYNHLEIRNQYNLSCKTSSDTETILALYDLKGEGCLSDFDGMFAFAIYDIDERSLFIARDRAGKKPLYIYQYNDEFVFSSELNALNGTLKLDVNNDNIYQYLRLGTCYGSQTPYKNVKELGAGTWLKLDLNTFNVHTDKWWSIDSYYNNSFDSSLSQSIEYVDDMLRTAIKRRLLSSDLEVGSFLSGGIDSGLVTAIASEMTDNLKTFTVSFDGTYDEAPLAKLVSDRYGTNHTEIPISFDNLKYDVENIISNYGEPFFDSSAIPSYYVSKSAKEHLTVILNGDGADELFGGYRRYVPYSYFDLFKGGAISRFVSNVGIKILPMPSNKKSKYNYLYRLLDLIQKKDSLKYLSSTVDIFEGFEKNLINKNSISKEFDSDISEILKSNFSGLQKIMCLDFNIILFSDLLVKMDIATMANSLEGRSPFLSKELLEYVPGINDKYKISGSTTKVLLRKLAERYLPDALINQPKRGFEIPLKNWVNSELKEIIHDYLGSNSFSENFVKRSFITALLDNNISIPAEKRAKILWTLFSLDVWYKKSYLSA